MAASSAAAGTPKVYMLMVKAQMTTAPIALANSEKRPPVIRVPPSTTARMASSS